MSPQQFSLRWNNHTKNLLQVFSDQFEREQNVDVTISCQGRFMKAHKIVLGACSPYFQDLFDAHESTRHPIIIMNGYNFEDVRSIVEFMYRGEVMVAETAMQRLLAAAEELQIKGLSNVRSKRDASQSGGYESSEEIEQDLSTHGSENSGGGSPQGSNRSDGSCPNGQSGMMRSRSNSNSFTAPSPVIGSGGAENAGKGTYLKRGRKRTRTVSYDTEMKRKLRVQNKYGQQHDQQDDASTPDSSDPTVDQLNNSSPSSSHSPKDEINMTINIEPPMIHDEDDLKDLLKLENGNANNDVSGTNGPVPLLIKPEPEVKEKIPRPPNSFMIFANEWRRQLAGQFPNESNKEISVRLGAMWKNLTEEVKAKYFSAARRANDDHKKKYPDYHYNPKEARMRKMWKLQQQQGHLVTTASHH